MNRASFDLLRSLYRAALAAVDPRRAVATALSRGDVAKALRAARKVGVFAVGKAADSMFRAAWRPGREGLIVLPRGHAVARRPDVRTLFAAHPEPDSSSVRAARESLRFFSRFGREDVLLCLVSGGASSLLCLPRRGVTLKEKKRAIRALVRSGAPIAEVNRLRTSLSAVKGGKLGRAAPARIVTLVVSDVPGDRPSLVGSGPTIRARRGDIVVVIASNGDGIGGAARKARSLGFSPRIQRRRLDGEARTVGHRLALRVAALRTGELLLAGGETTVALGRIFGTGGRNLELALAAALAFGGRPQVALLAAGSDGKDGSSRAAGAFVDGGTAGRARKLGLDPAEALSRHDTEPFFSRVGGLLVTGPTGTNVSDWVFGGRVHKTRTGKLKMGNERKRAK
jgi:hydroxypyruvate reductase